MDKPLKCSFCGRGEDEVDKLVAGTGGRTLNPSVYICDRCVEKANRIMASADADGPDPGNGSSDRNDAWDDS